MTRIIGGLLGSRRLGSPAKSTRPTADRIRESIFGALEARGLIEGASVLDLYAGTGALAFEALSRGAHSAVLVESNRQAAAVCIANSRLIQDGLIGQGVEVRIRTAITPTTKFLATSNESFDLVFIDPPYDIGNDDISQELQQLLPRLKQNAWVILERSSRGEIPNFVGYDLTDQKVYGDTVVYWLRPS